MDDTMGNQRFSITPARAVIDNDLSDSVFRTLAIIGIYGDKNGWCWPKQRTLARYRNVSRQTISKHIKELIERGYLNTYNQFDEDTGAQIQNKMQIKFDFDFTGGVNHIGLQGVEGSGVDTLTPHINAPIEHKDSSSAKKPPKAKSAYNIAYETLEEHFTIKRGCRKPDWNTASDRTKRALSVRWKTPLMAIWKECGEDTENAKTVIERAIGQMLRDKLTISAPQSILEVAKSIAANMNRKQAEQYHIPEGDELERQRQEFLNAETFADI